LTVREGEQNGREEKHQRDNAACPAAKAIPTLTQSRD
jgi:hypothetical protein